MESARSHVTIFVRGSTRRRIPGIPAFPLPREKPREGQKRGKIGPKDASAERVVRSLNDLRSPIVLTCGGFHEYVGGQVATARRQLLHALHPASRIFRTIYVINYTFAIKLFTF